MKEIVVKNFIFIPVKSDAYRFALIQNPELKNRYGKLEWMGRKHGTNHAMYIGDGIEYFEEVDLLSEILKNENQSARILGNWDNPQSCTARQALKAFKQTLPRGDYFVIENVAKRTLTQQKNAKTNNYIPSNQ